MSCYPEWDEAHARRCQAQYDFERAEHRKLMREAIARRRARPTVTAGRLFIKWADMVQHEREVFITAAVLAGPDDDLVLDIDGLIDDAVFADIVPMLRAHPTAKRIILTVNSRGGAPKAAQKIAAALIGHTGRKTAIVTGRCDSAAIYVLLACGRRLAVPSASLQLHQTTADAYDNMSAADRDAHRRADDKIEVCLADARGIDRTKYSVALEANLEFNADDAVQFGILDGIADDADLALLHRPAPARLTNTNHGSLLPPAAVPDDEAEDCYEVETTGGEIVALPFRADARRFVRALALDKTGREVVIGLARPYLEMLTREIGARG